MDAKTELRSNNVLTVRVLCWRADFANVATFGLNRQRISVPVLLAKNEATKPAAFYLLQQHERFDNFIGVYNNERPHLPRTTQDQPQLCVRWPNYWRTRGHDYIWLVSFLEYDLGYFDRERDRVEPDPSPFTPDKVLTMSPVRT